MFRPAHVIAATLAAFSLAPVAHAGSPEASGPAPVLVLPEEPAAAGGGLVFTLGLGAATKPAYFGSDEYVLGPSGSFSLHYLGVGRFSFGDPDPAVDPLGWGLRGSFRYVGERDASEYGELAGLDDTDAAVELGLGVGYTARNFAGFVDVRRGFGGHESWVGEAGLDVIARPGNALTLSLGPRLFWGDDAYAATYFGVTPAEAGATLPAYAPDGGLLSAGLELGMTYRLSDDWGLEGAVTYERFTGDAESSPIVQQGSRDQWGVSIGVTRVIRIGG